MAKQLWRPGQRQAILWGQVGGLTALQGAISLAWLAYNLYVPQLLKQFGFAPQVGITLLIVESVLGMVMEPVMGVLSDRAKRWLGTRFPMIVLGVLLAAGLFLGIPAIALWANPESILRWLLLILLVAWSLAMTVFRSPALALLGSYAFSTQLPKAASWLSLVSALVSLTGIVAKPIILSWGPVATFALGSGVLIATVIGLHQVNPDTQISLSATGSQLKQPVTALPYLGLIFATGLGIALGNILLRTVVDASSMAPGISLSLIFTLASIVLILPAGELAVRWGNVIAMRVGLVAIALALLLLPLTAGSLLSIVLVIFMGAASGLVANGTLPFALSLVPPTQAGLGTGLFFSGSALATSLFSSALEAWEKIPPGTAAIVGAIAFIAAGITISWAPRSTTS
jgi:Major Facilitator Superfamily